MSYAWYVQLPLEFPEGVHFGAGKRFNSLSVVRDGLNRPVLNGSSLAGVMRTIWADYLRLSKQDAGSIPDQESIQDQVDRLFGRAINDKQDRNDQLKNMFDRQSCVKFTNYPIVNQLVDSDSSFAVDNWTYHHRDRHRGTVIDQCLYDVESCPPGSAVKIGFWIFETVDSDVDEDEVEEFFEVAEEFIEVVVSALQYGVLVGGSSNRGFGRSYLQPESVRWKRYDLTVLEEHAAQLDAHREWRSGQEPQGLEKYEPEGKRVLTRNRPFIATITLAIPAGQDILIGAGTGDEVQSDPQQIISADGKPLWRLPGSSLRGLFKNWMTRLASREAVAEANKAQTQPIYPTHDDAASYLARKASATFTGEMLGWCNQESKKRDGFVPDKNWTITSLFGSCFSRGRIKFGDGYAPCTSSEIKDCPEAQIRMHVAVDRITGGAAPGLLFDNRVLAPHETEIKFPVRIRIDDPLDHEIRWLIQTLVALHIGLLRVGSSKASGRLTVADLDFESITDNHKSLVASTLKQTDLEQLI